MPGRKSANCSDDEQGFSQRYLQARCRSRSGAGSGRITAPEILRGRRSGASTRAPCARDERFLAVLPQRAFDPEQQWAERRAIERGHHEAAVAREIVGVGELDLVGLVPHQDPRLLTEPEVGEDAFDRADLLIAIRIARVDDVDAADRRRPSLRASRETRRTDPSGDRG